MGVGGKSEAGSSCGAGLQLVSAHCICQAAQEREELQRKGDDLDAKIQKAEREIKALGNTLTLMNSRNETFRKSLTQVESKGMLWKRQGGHVCPVVLCCMYVCM